MRGHFETGITKTYAFRKRQLTAFKQSIVKNQKAIEVALYQDLKKSPEETWVTETGFVIAEISNILNNLKRWMQPERTSTNLLNIPSKSFIVKEPLGVVLIIAPWNYPLQLLFTPLAGAIAAGNCVVLKASEFAPATAAVMKQIVAEVFDDNYVLFTDGAGETVIPAMMNSFVFDHVFYTGSIAVGKLIYTMAAANLVPVTLELGGKSPCIVEADADINVTAKRVVMGKFSNTGQMCITPDYLLVHADVKNELIIAMKKALLNFFGEDAKDSYDYGRIINQKQFARLVHYLADGDIIYGGAYDEKQLYIEPALMDNIKPGSAIMREEIFGPLLPIIEFTTMKQAKDIIANNPNPLALYVFTSSSKKEKEWINAIPFGGGCINNVALHVTNHQLPFGGRGFSGTGNYHGKFSFDTFTHKKGILKSPVWFDPDVKYPSYKGKLKLFKWLNK